MRKLLVVIAIIFSLSASAQNKKSDLALREEIKEDSTVIITTSKDTLIYILNQIQAQVDSKKISNELIAFLTKRIQIVATKR